MTVFIGHNSKTATQYIEDLHPQYALKQLVLDSNEFGIVFLKHLELTTMSKGIGGAL